MTPQMTVLITLEDGRLHALPTGQSKLPLFAESEDRFLPACRQRADLVHESPFGEVTALVLHQGGREQSARRVR